MAWIVSACINFVSVVAARQLAVAMQRRLVAATVRDRVSCLHIICWPLKNISQPITHHEPCDTAGSCATQQGASTTWKEDSTIKHPVSFQSLRTYRSRGGTQNCAATFGEIANTGGGMGMFRRQTVLTPKYPRDHSEILAFKAQLEIIAFAQEHFAALSLSHLRHRSTDQRDQQPGSQLCHQVKQATA